MLVFIGILLSVSIVAVCVQHYDLALQQHKISFFAGALRNAFSKEDVSIGGTSYHVDNGVVYRGSVALFGTETEPALRLAYEKTLARRSPLISLAGADPQALATAIQSLSKARDGLVEMQSNMTAAALVQSSLYPFDFLNDSAEVERLRLAFLQTGSDTDAGMYEHALEKTVDDYEKDLTRYRIGFVAMVPSNIRTYTTAGLLISRADTLRAIDSLSEGMDRTHILLNARLSCLNGVFSKCRPEDLVLPHLPVPDKGLITPAQIGVAQSIRGLLVKDFRQEGKDLSTAPLIELNRSLCLAGTDLAPLFVVFTSKSWIDASPETEATYVGDIRLTKAAAYPTVPYEDFFSSQGSTYVPNYLFSHYACPYFAQDIGDVFAVRATSNIAERTPVSAYATGAIKQKLLNLEASLALPNSVLHESDALEYARTAVALAEDPQSPPTLLDQAADIALLFKNQSAGFPFVVSNIAEVERLNILASSKQGLPVDLSAQTFFYYRSGLTALFMADNPSVQYPADSYFTPYNVPLSRQPYVFYSSLVNNPTALAQADSDMVRYYATHPLFGTTTSSTTP